MVNEGKKKSFLSDYLINNKIKQSPKINMFSGLVYNPKKQDYSEKDIPIF